MINWDKSYENVRNRYYSRLTNLLDKVINRAIVNNFK